MASSKKATPSRAAPGIAGASGGTGVLGLAALIPDEYHFIKLAITYASPSISIIFWVAWAWASTLLETRAQTWELNRMLRDARTLRDQIVNDNNSSPAHRKIAQENVEKLERLAMGAISDQAHQFEITIAGSKINPA